VDGEPLQQPIEGDETAGGGRLQRISGRRSGNGLGPRGRKREKENEKRDGGFLHRFREV
jgi:hypothetical protein